MMLTIIIIIFKNIQTQLFKYLYFFKSLIRVLVFVFFMYLIIIYCFSLQYNSSHYEGRVHLIINILEDVYNFSLGLPHIALYITRPINCNGYQDKKLNFKQIVQPIGQCGRLSLKLCK